MDPRGTGMPLLGYFAGLAEYTFESRLGVADPPLVDYIARLLVRFIHGDAIYKVRGTTGEPLHEVAEMVVEAEARQGSAARQVHRHIGDYTLFWTGLYPEAVDRLKERSRLDRYLNYHEQGKRAYLIASTLDPDERDEFDNSVLERLSHDYDLCAYGLSELRREWQRRDDEAGGKPIVFE